MSHNQHLTIEINLKKWKYNSELLTYVTICGGIFTLQMTDMGDLHRIKMTDDLNNNYKWIEIPRWY